MMFALAKERPRRALLRAYRGNHGRDGAWHGTDWQEFARQAASAARALRAAGVSAGDRVVIVSENRPEYVIAETALMAIRAVPVPTYTTNTVADHAHVLRDSGACAAIVSTAAFAAKLREAGPLDLLVAMDAPPPDAPGPRVLAWTDLVRDTAPPDDIAAEAATIPTDALACLIYTSGTGGTPKGVMLPHRSILSNCQGAAELIRPLKLRDETYLSFLPLSHSFEHTVGQFFLPSLWTEIVFARGIEHLAADMLAVRPTIMTVVPRILEAIHGRVLTGVARQPAWRQRLFRAALAIGTKRAEGGRLSLPERLADPVLDRLVRARVLERFGGRLRAVMSGGARLEPAIGRFFLALGLDVMQGYGQTEAGPVISANPPGATRIDTVGLPLRGVELRIAEDGEILVRGDLVMAGYWGQPQATAEVIRDGWLHTGDVGELDADGYLRITDRKRDIIVLSGGDNVSPAKIEGVLIAEPEIAQAVVTGDGRAGVTALVVPAEGFDELGAAVAISRANMRLSVTERVRKHIAVPPFTVENGLLTPTQKIRRQHVLRAHAERLAEVHGG
ncbi:MAG: long-chain fatty acid--CoA ligase [Proteobacteria bacterium]|nr:long-chain fatty acid--CoA ligase [Pseudomonadota bacterium]